MHFTREGTISILFLIGIFLMVAVGVVYNHSLNSNEAEADLIGVASVEEYDLYYSLDNPFEVIARDKDGKTYETLGYSTERGYIYEVIGDGS